MSSKRSRVHPKYKTKYRVGNWPEYDRSLVRRGDLTLWLSPSAISNWTAKPSGCRGGQRKYSDLAIETALTLRLLLHLPLRQTEGFLLSIFELMGVHLVRASFGGGGKSARALESATNSARACASAGPGGGRSAAIRLLRPALSVPVDERYHTHLANRLSCGDRNRD